MALGTGNTNPDENSSVVVEIKEQVVNVFFDGTRNNMYNVESSNKLTGKDTDSYRNALSNIAHMYKSAEGVNVYVKGAGTTTGQRDDTDGYAFGTGASGIVTHAQGAFRQIADQIKGANTKRGTSQVVVHHMTLNVFGFSRGAATARHFVDIVDRNKAAESNPFNAEGIQIKSFNVNYVGLFDTVSSFATTKSEGITQHLTKTNSWFYDVNQLGLKIDKSKAQYVFHLTAGDEFRTNFSLTNIQTSLNQGIGYELQIPGAHSDIGGGYNDNEREALRWTSGQAKGFYEHLPWWGWYSTDQIYTQEIKSTAPQYDIANYGKTLYWNHWTKTRTISNEYYKVALKIMAEITKLHCTVKFKDSLPVGTSDSTIQYLQGVLLKRALSNHNSKLRDTDKWVLPYNDDKAAAWSRGIYNKYFHFSANFTREGWDGAFTIPFIPNIDSNGKPYRLTIAG